MKVIKRLNNNTNRFYLIKNKSLKTINMLFMHLKAKNKWGVINKIQNSRKNSNKLQNLRVLRKN